MDWTHWQPGMRATLLFVVRDGEILLIRKKRGLGAGKINGPGGKIEPGETPLASALRETQEELCIEPTDPEEAGILRFQFTDGLALECHVFRATKFRGEAVETDEAIPRWTPVDAIPYQEMWADDALWLPLLLQRRKFQAWFEFDDETMLSHEVRETSPGSGA
ncbi:MAG: 8-oxo-dGTP diphosphatase [Verrucomicrobiales bacterium]|nr:8-oxo-dGTP diphosphatase [Verrucomicrobiales bacterium]